VSELGAVWVTSEPTPDGGYVVSLEFDDDTARPLHGEVETTRYVEAVLTAAGWAEYDAAAVAQLCGKMGMPLEVAGQAVTDLRQNRPAIDDEATAPLRLTPGVAGNPAADGVRHAFIAVHLRDKQLGQWTVADARGHALHVLEAALNTRMDAAYRLLLHEFGLDDETARAAVMDIGNFREQVQ
jgi:hypothetical protein